MLYQSGVTKWLQKTKRHGDNSVQLTVRSILILHSELAQAKIAESNVTSVVQENIFRLEIPVDNIETMETLQCTQKLGGIKAGAIDVESLFTLEMMK